ncbi:hypothetical protein [Psychrobacter proteolyticus]|uniref:hypothetical protein n=1 Tax=Psychrobacter proteolyticus TaxID=147825 RepID=UPI000E0B5891|nr:hypothetical protein [Psychrobacter proteolyticus]
MSMREQQGRITSNLLTQFEATQDAYADVIVKLNLILINDKTHEQVVRAKLFEVMDERNKLNDCSISELYVMQKSIKEKINDFLAGLNEQYVTA